MKDKCAHGGPERGWLGPREMDANVAESASSRSSESKKWVEGGRLNYSTFRKTDMGSETRLARLPLTDAAARAYHMK